MNIATIDRFGAVWRVFVAIDIDRDGDKDLVGAPYVAGQPTSALAVVKLNAGGTFDPVTVPPEGRGGPTHRSAAQTASFDLRLFAITASDKPAVR